jgi:inosine-uridine nucleoside N-ribohydrolase
MTTQVLLDCDPGHDDAIALLLALASDAVTLRGVTTVAGNQTLEKTTQNALTTLTLADRTDVPVVAGIDRPLVREQVLAEYVHGESGLDGADLPDPVVEAADDHAVDIIVEEARCGGLTLIATGPLSNVAFALRRAPDISDQLDRIVLMGGSVRDGNITPAAEFNIFADPETARVVFESDVPVVMVGLDVTRQARIGPDGIERIRDMRSEVAVAVADLLEFFAEFHREQYGWESLPIHDALAVAEVIKPGILETEHMHVGVETQGKLTYGRTVADIRGVTNKEPNAHVALDVDRDAFFDLLYDALKRY